MKALKAVLDRTTRRCAVWAVILLGLPALSPLAHAQTPAGGIEYFHIDPLGSTRLVTDGEGNVVSRHDYLPFGEEIPGGQLGRDAGLKYGADEDLRHQFTGKERDGESGLDYFGARYYSGPQGRFTSADDVFNDMDVADPQSWNRYAYVRNSPLTNVDPDGRAWENLVWQVQDQATDAQDAVSAASTSAQNDAANTGSVPLAVWTTLQAAPTEMVVNGFLDLVNVGRSTGEALEGDETLTGFAAAATEDVARAAGIFTLLGGAAVKIPGVVAEPEPYVPYNRSKHYGGSQTDSPAAKAARAAGEGKTCPSCPEKMVSGTKHAPSPQHDPPLVKHFHEYGGKKMTPAQRRAYARSAKSINGTQCKTCQNREGRQMARYSQERNKRGK